MQTLIIINTAKELAQTQRALQHYMHLIRFTDTGEDPAKDQSTGLLEQNARISSNHDTVPLRWFHSRKGYKREVVHCPVFFSELNTLSLPPSGLNPGHVVVHASTLSQSCWSIPGPWSLDDRQGMHPPHSTLATTSQPVEIPQESRELLIFSSCWEIKQDACTLTLVCPSTL